MLAKLGERGYAHLDREITEYRDIYRNPIVFTVWGHCLLNAAYCEKLYGGVALHPGQFITSHESMADECGISVKQARSAMERLKKSHLIELERAGKGRKSGTLVTVANSQFAELNAKGVSLENPYKEPETATQKGNYLISNKENEKETEEQGLEPRDHPGGDLQDRSSTERDIFQFMMRCGFTYLPTTENHMTVIKALLAAGNDPEEIKEEIKLVTYRAHDSTQSEIEDSLKYLYKRMDHKKNGWTWEDNEYMHKGRR